MIELKLGFRNSKEMKSINIAMEETEENKKALGEFFSLISPNGDGGYTIVSAATVIKKNDETNIKVRSTGDFVYNG